ncbi:hypothetical protein GWI33_007708 [Rhynchophorus ferrugineus]|uniref:Uncharacterized protein n=1 Tax=Rhynchophorus ferrugineus TaxID=354439 RepID=A0A834MEQ0_RHYFE|nr:hypothetical protein GWI33_007708 [Rhynchophorus ferrugineus]
MVVSMRLRSPAFDLWRGQRDISMICSLREALLAVITLRRRGVVVAVGSANNYRNGGREEGGTPDGVNFVVAVSLRPGPVYMASNIKVPSEGA